MRPRAFSELAEFIQPFNVDWNQITSYSDPWGAFSPANTTSSAFYDCEWLWVSLKLKTEQPVPKGESFYLSYDNMCARIISMSALGTCAYLASATSWKRSSLRPDFQPSTFGAVNSQSNVTCDEQNGIGRLQLSSPISSSPPLCQEKQPQLCAENSYDEKQKQLWENLLANPSDWSDERLDKRSARHPDFRHKRSGEVLWLSNRHKPGRVDSRLANLSAQPQKSVGGVGGSFPVRSSASGEEVRSLSEQGQLDKALDALWSKNEPPSADTYRTLLKACSKRKALARAKRVHAHLAKHGMESFRFLGESVVSTFVKCGGLEDALEVFHRLPNRSVFSWTALISGYTMSGHGKEALRLYNWMQEEGVQPDAYTVVSLLKACGSIPDLKEGRRIHGDALKYRCEADLFVCTSLIDMYAKCGSIADAQTVFSGLSYPDVVSWNVMLTAYVEQGQAEEALQLYEQMRVKGVSPSNRTFVSMFQACGMLAEKEEAVLVDGQAFKVMFLAKGKAIHVNAWQKGGETDVFVASTLVSMYGKCGSIVDAQNVLDGLSKSDVVVWNAMLTTYVEQRQAEKALQLYAVMREHDISPNNRTFVATFQACGMLAEKEKDVVVVEQSLKVKSHEKGKVIYADICRNGCPLDDFVGTTLVSLFGKCGSIKDAKDVFDKLSQCNVVSWNAMLTAYVEQGQAEQALVAYEKMQEQGVTPDAWTYVSVIQACGMLAETEEGILVNGQLSKPKSLEMGKVLHSAVCSNWLDTNVFVGSTLVSVFGKCWSIVDAEYVFNGLAHRDAVVWNALLASYIEQKQAETAFEVYVQMREQGISPDAWTFVSSLHACHMLAHQEDDVMVDGKSAKVNSFGKGKAIHADARRRGYDSDVFLGSTLVTLYGKCGSTEDAQNVFDGLSKRDVVAWNSILAAHVEQGEAEKSFQLYELLREQDLSPDAWTFANTLQACGMLAKNEDDVKLVDGQYIKVKSLEKGERVHADIFTKGYASDVYVCTTLISMYGNCGSVRNAQKVFDGLSMRNLVSWNAMLTAYVEQGHAEKALQLYERMWEEGVSPDAWTFVYSVQACGILADKEEEVLVDGDSRKLRSIAKGGEIHADAQQKGYGSDLLVGNALVSMYAKCGSIVDAQSVFDGMSDSDVVSWNSLLAAYIEQQKGEKVLQLYRQLREEGVSGDPRTFVITLQACGIVAEEEEGFTVNGRPAKVKTLVRGKMIHDEIWRKGYEANVYIGSTLVSVYGKCGSILDAQIVFEGPCQRNVVSWNAMLAAYVELGKARQALQLYERMQEEGVSPSCRTFVSILQSCGLLAEEEEEVMVDGQCLKVDSLKLVVAIHADTRRRGYDSDIYIANTLVSMYGKCGSIADAWRVFDELSERGRVSWNSMLSAYVENGQAEKCLQLYTQMQLEGVKQDKRTFVSMLQACGMLAEKEEEVVVGGQSTKVKSLEQGKVVHDTVFRMGYDLDVFVGNTIISMYGKCGSVWDAWNVFKTLAERNIVSWNAMLVSFVEQGYPEDALELYRQMEQEGVSPNEITLVCILRACSRTGSLGLVKQIHHMIVSTRNELSPVLSNTLISAYGISTSMDEAQTAFDAIPQPDVISWNALIAAYARQGRFPSSLLCYERMCLAGVKPDGVTFLSLLSACSHAGMVDKGAEYFEQMVRCHSITPEIQHYVTMVDLFGRAGCFESIQGILSAMPMPPDLAMWLCLLGACRKHKKVVLGEQAFDGAVRLHPQHPAAYMLMSNIYADAGLSDQAKKVTKLRENEGAWKKPGRCWIEDSQEVHSFLVGDHTHQQQEELYDMLRKVKLRSRKAADFTSTHNHLRDPKHWSCFRR